MGIGAIVRGLRSQANKQRLVFACNVCGARNDVPLDQIRRDASSCTKCGSSERMRSLVHLLSLALLGRSVPLPQFPRDKTVIGAGLSDWPGYAEPLASKFNYRNTFFHTEPRLDIISPPAEMLGSLHFLISSDVFEHVPPPIFRAFDGAFALLRPGGHLIFSVPYNGGDASTIEHYPEMQDFAVGKIADRHFVVVLQNDGALALDANPVFHGGPGQTLEMRVFGERDLLAHLRRTGFTEIRVLSEAIPEFGIHFFEGLWSLPILARKPL